MTMNTMNPTVVEKQKINRQVRTFRPILASSDGDKLPSRIELLKVGLWDTPNHGVFVVTSEDLVQYKENFDNGVAQAGDSGIMIDYDHNKGIAAGWIKGLEIATDANGLETLFGTVEWTGVGKRDLLEKNYKCISPEFYPASRGGWEDPEKYGVYIPNVLAAAGLVNRPLFKGLTPIMASADSGSEGREDKNVIFISASEKEKTMPTLEEIRVKDLNSLTEEDKTFLTEHKSELTAEEQSKFGFEVSETTEAKAEREAAEAKAKQEADAKLKAEADAAEAARNTAPDLTAAQPVMASAVKGDEGKVVMAASEVKELVDFKTAAERATTTELVKKHVARGAIVASEEGSTVDLLMGADRSTRTTLESMFEKLPSNEVLAGENGSSEKAGNAVSANEQILTKANAAVTASEGLSLKDAIIKVRSENPELAKQANEEANQ